MSNLKHHTSASFMRRHSHAGFTLLEILVVIGLLSILALGMAAMLEDDGHAQRDEDTKQRWNAIRKAIVGEPYLAPNGSPVVAGYVSDMGRLPLTIAELISQDTPLCYDHDNNPVTPPLAIQQPEESSIISIPNYVAATGFTNTIIGGWRGPYIYTAGSQFFGDGWFGFKDGQESFAPKDTEDVCNFKWLVIPTFDGAPTLANITDLQVQSLGNDRVLSGSASAEDYPAGGVNMINMNEWTLSAAPITINIQFNRAVITTDIPLLTTPPNPPHELQMVVYRYVDNGNATAIFADDIDEIRSPSTFTLSAGTTFAPAQSISLDGLPIGRYAAVVWCTNNNNLPTPPATPDYTDDVVYDGNCDSTGGINHSPVYFTLTQSTSQVTIVWNLP